MNARNTNRRVEQGGSNIRLKSQRLQIYFSKVNHNLSNVYNYGPPQVKILKVLTLEAKFLKVLTPWQKLMNYYGADVWGATRATGEGPSHVLHVAHS